MKVLKFGGTSVGSPERIEQLLPIIRSQQSDKHLVVLSAVSGTTNDLVKLSELYENKDIEAAYKHIDGLEQKYIKFVNELFKTEKGILEALAFIDKVFDLFYQFKHKNFSSTAERIILAQGEIISTTLFHLYLKEKEVSSVLLSALDFMVIDEDKEPNIDKIRKQAAVEIAKYQEDTLFITQGYICRNAQGEIDNLQRGGSDYTASLLGAALQTEEIQIWTDIDGFHNNDPRYVQNTKSIARLSFDEAAELSYFGAKILHPQSVFPARKYNVPVRLLDTMNPSAVGTLISGRLPIKIKLWQSLLKMESRLSVFNLHVC